MFLLNDEVQHFSFKSDHFWSFFQWDKQMHGVLWIYAFTLAFVAPNCWEWFFFSRRVLVMCHHYCKSLSGTKSYLIYIRPGAQSQALAIFSIVCFFCFFLSFLLFFAFFILFLFWLLLNFSTPLQSRFFFNNFKRFSQWLPWLFYLLIADKMRNSQDSRNF